MSAQEMFGLEDQNEESESRLEATTVRMICESVGKSKLFDRLRQERWRERGDASRVTFDQFRQVFPYFPVHMMAFRRIPYDHACRLYDAIIKGRFAKTLVYKEYHRLYDELGVDRETEHFALVFPITGATRCVIHNLPRSTEVEDRHVGFPWLTIPVSVYKQPVIHVVETLESFLRHLDREWADDLS